MKFLCDQCKAKYQISDDKVAGKTVRMKCRKCGHMIEVRAAVTETSVATGAPSEPPTGAGGSGAKAPPAKPAALPKSSLATSLSQAKPPVPRPGAKPETGGLATAFKSSMQTTDEAALLELSSADEWYAAINGVPVGPIRIGELRRKAALGAVTDDSLVWQDGMEEWRPVKTVPELAALVREAAASKGVSLVSPEPPNARQSALPPPPASMRPGPARPTPPRPAGAPSEPPRPGQAAARSNVVPINSRLATAEKLEEAPTSERFSIAPDPFLAPPAAAATAATPPAAAAPAVAAPATAPVPVIAPAQPRQPNYIAIGMIVLFATFGVTAALVIFRQPAPVQQQPQVIRVEVPAAPTAAPVASAAETAAPVDSAAAAASSKVGKGTAVASVKPAASAKGGVDLSGLLGGAGPNVSTGGGGGAGPGGSLSSAQLEGVVRSHQLAVRRTCWERGASTMASANETVALTIGGDGRVQNASAAGNDPVTGTCLEKEVRLWQFPAAGMTSSVNIPFHFVRQ